jgi:hypothetical protein
MTDYPADSCITERETPDGYWWRYKHAKGEPQETLTAATAIALSVAADQARKFGKNYLVALRRPPSPEVYIFACDDPDANRPDLYTAFEFTPAGERIRHKRPT